MEGEPTEALGEPTEALGEPIEPPEEPPMEPTETLGEPTEALGEPTEALGEPIEPPEEPPMEPTETLGEPTEALGEPTEALGEPIEPPEEPPMEPTETLGEPTEALGEPTEALGEPIEPPEEPELPPGDGIETGGPPDGDETPRVDWQFARTSTAESATQKPEIRTVSFIAIDPPSGSKLVCRRHTYLAYHRRGIQPLGYLMRQSAIASLAVLVVIQPAAPHGGRIVPVPFLLALLPNAPHHPGSQVEQHKGEREQRAHVVEEKAEEIHV